MDLKYWDTYIRQRRFYKDIREMTIADTDRERVSANFFAIGGHQGWYYGDWLWQLRGWMDQLAGGPGLKRGRVHPTALQAGDHVDVWRVLEANKASDILLLKAEMKMPGEAWLHFQLKDNKIVQTAIYVPGSVFGDIYWASVWPFHGFIFPGMLRGIVAHNG
ncbi:DUF2867 domain-containing protein [Chitinophaga sp. Cy-1792]|uniref:DUF2867 domain-containing protein n=1 Tax=Chitinophaga sp. Cy-1792 TaxID=2608339 RepID=UPI0019634BD2|nr:DUF2867 domain-containing protein [Chitinophaga sp. Cy-1792]